jgi:hypothetical protein
MLINGKEIKVKRARSFYIRKVPDIVQHEIVDPPFDR